MKPIFYYTMGMRVMDINMFSTIMKYSTVIEASTTTKGFFVISFVISNDNFR